MSDERPHEDGNRQTLLIIGLAGLVVLSLASGFVGGYLVGSGRRLPAPETAALVAMPPPPAGAVGALPAAAAAGPIDPLQVHPNCPFDLPAKDQWMLAGWTCNCKQPHCNNMLLLGCHCDVAHSMKALVKQLIVEGMDPNRIGAELEKHWGPGIRPKS
jgi:hypothetical protein